MAELSTLGNVIKTAYEAQGDTNAFTDAEQLQLAGLTGATVTSVNGATGAVVLDADDIDGTLTTNKYTTAADISKLAGIETAATADQSNAEIKVAYEANTNTNAFTDASVTKLAGIETAATADQSNAEIKVAYEANADTNAYTDASVTKLAGIETAATADQTITLTGAVTGSGTGTFTTVIPNSSLTYTKLQNTTGTDVLLGRSTAGAGVLEEVPLTAAGRALIDDASASAQRTTLGLGTIATQSASSVVITGGTVTGITDLAVADGGTGSSTATAAFTALKQAATETSTGVVEKANAAEVLAETTDKYPDASLIKHNAGVAKVGVNFNGTGVVAIRDSHNVSSITDNGTGDYTVNFSNAFANANYTPEMSAGNDTVLTGSYLASGREANAAPTASAFRMGTLNGGTFADLSRVYFKAFGDLA